MVMPNIANVVMVLFKAGACLAAGVIRGRHRKLL
jgi:hypothetical protein